MMCCAIYIIKNIVNDKVYVGQTWTPVARRFIYHKVPTNKSCIKLHNALNKHGRDNFFVECIADCSDQKTADYLEANYIIEYDSIKNGYNIREGGSRGLMSKESIEKISAAMMGSGNPMYGRNHTDASRKKISEHKNNSGEHNPRAILTEELAEKIRQDTRTERKIAKEYGVARSTINSIKRGIIWRKNDNKQFN